MNKGFTLVEILIVITILGVLTTFLVATTRESDKGVFIFTEQAKLIGVISRAKSLSIETFKDTDICGYGVHFLPTEKKYWIFKNTDSSTEGKCGRPENKRFSGNEGDILEEHFLADGVEFENNQLPGNLADIFFAPPRPDIFFNPPQSDNKAEIPLKITDKETRVVVTVSYAGQITTE